MINQPKEFWDGFDSVEVVKPDDEDPQADTTLTDEQIEAIKKAALVNTLNNAYTTAVANDQSEAAQKQRELEALQREIKTNTTKLCIFCPYELADYPASIITSVQQDGGCDCCGAGSEYIADVDIYCTHCYRLVYTS